MSDTPFPRERFSFIAHGAMDLCNPISRVKHERLIEVLGLTAGQRVLDVGAGKGTLLLDLVERCGVWGVAVEPAQIFADVIEREAHRRGVSRGVTLLRSTLADARASADFSGLFDCACCIGSTHAFGDTSACVRGLRDVVRPGGLAVVGLGYWKRPPAPEYLVAMGAAAEENTTHAGNIGLLVREGLVPVWATTASDDEWDEYEWAYARNIEDFARANPGDPDTARFLERSRGWRDIVAAWGRETLGFGLYVARRA
ncbi:MAG TPA: methyltransferase domain-containing protein [Phycisphaerales bacterium]|nr:methyltransferase domain-containing protein [Phycisphaerales bacterium]